MAKNTVLVAVLLSHANDASCFAGNSFSMLLKRYHVLKRRLTGPCAGLGTRKRHMVSASIGSKARFLP